jgi:hypothetical protein
MSANISFALDNFDHEDARKGGERAMRRLNRMFGAISATNEAILRAKTEQDLYQRVCDAAVYAGKSFAAVVLLAEPGSIWLKPVAGSGEIVEQITRTRFSIDPDNIYGTGVSGNAFRTQKPCINSDILNSQQGQPWREAGRQSGAVACVALPLIKAGGSVGVLMFFVSKSWAADEEIIALLARIAENVSFALDNFWRAEQKAKADEQKESLTRMLAALSATNEAIMRAKSRTQLHELVCEAATKGGRFNSVNIMLVKPGSRSGGRRDVFHLLRARHVHARIRRTVAEARRQCVLCARKLRSGRREGEDRGSEGAPDAHVPGAKRYQRSDHSGQIPRGTLRTGVRSRGEWRQVHLDHHRAGQSRQRCS